MKTMIYAALAAVAVAVCAAPAAIANTDRVRVVSATINAGSLADAAGETQTVAVPGAVLGDACLASAGVTVAGITVTCFISAADVASIRIQNESGGTLDLASTTWRIFLFPKGTR
jgi:ribosomal protein L18E